ncbi:MAG TPA: hypothetical protein VMH50_01065 [Thermoleophilia bacterium]|nr:hypothetical protein [Thermoleophilia bacterium]
MTDTTKLEACFRDISFPADGRTVAECAEGNLCPRDVVAEVRQRSSQTFLSEAELLCVLGDRDACGAD